MHSYEDSAKFNSAFSATTLSDASRFRWKREVIKNFEYLGKFKAYFWKYWLYCVLYLLVTERCKKKFKNRLWKSRACVSLSKPLLERDNWVFIKYAHHWLVRPHAEYSERLILLVFLFREASEPTAEASPTAACPSFSKPGDLAPLQSTRQCNKTPPRWCDGTIAVMQDGVMVP
jgi:hypothetical protein